MYLNKQQKSILSLLEYYQSITYFDNKFGIHQKNKAFAIKRKPLIQYANNESQTFTVICIGTPEWNRTTAHGVGGHCSIH